MIHGSGLVATAMRRFLPGASAATFAAGVANSQCVDAGEFERERARLVAALELEREARRFVYFSTCSLADPVAAATAYGRHKLAMEALVRERHARWLILRMPQLAGASPNPHTLLNYLYQRILRAERFRLQADATRNVIDIEDAAKIAGELVMREGACHEIINVATPCSIPVVEIVGVLERLAGKRAVYDSVVGGTRPSIDVARVTPIAGRLGIQFDEGYLERILQKYYGVSP